MFLGQSDLATGLGSSVVCYLNTAATSDLYTTGTSGSPATPYPVINTWSHVAYVRYGATWKTYLNGVQVGTSTPTGSVNAGAVTYVPSIGAFSNNSNYFNGYISNFRIVTGTAVYTSNFTPSIAPLTAISGTSLLTLQDNRFKDNSSNNFAITATGTPSIQAFSPFAPAAAYSTSAVGGSTYFHGTVDCISVPANAAFAPGTGNFTVEGWFYATAAVGTYGGVLYSQTINGINYFAIFAGQSGSNTILITMTLAGGGTPIYSSTTFALNTWNHFAVARVSGSVTVYLNGIGGTTTTNTTNLTNTTWNPTIGRYSHDVTNYFPGYISNVRYINGTALYTANFTPPTAPLTAITNTSLLLNGTNAAIFDQTAKNNLFTANTANVSTTQSEFGGSSMKFNGTTDFLTANSTPNLDLSTGDYTIELWAYSTATTNAVDSCLGWGGNSIMLYHDATNWTYEVGNGSSVVFQITTPYTAIVWVNLALTRNANTFTLWKNGVSSATSTSSTSISLTGKTLYIGVNGYIGLAQKFTGYIDDLRITKGIARYTANFTPSAYAFQDQ